MTVSKRFLRMAAWSLMIALILGLALGVAPLAASPSFETSAYYSVVRDKAYAPYTTADEFQRSSVVAYYSVVKDKPFAPYTTADEFKRTSVVAYYSVLH